MRRFLNFPIFGATEIVCYVSLVVTCFALSQNEWIDGNIRMTLLLENLKRKGGFVLLFIVNVVCAVFYIVFSYLFIGNLIVRLGNMSTSYDLNIPLWIPTAVMAFGVCSLTVCLIVKAIMYFVAIKTDKAYSLRNMSVLDAGDDFLE